MYLAPAERDLVQSGSINPMCGLRHTRRAPVSFRIVLSGLRPVFAGFEIQLCVIVFVGAGHSAELVFVSYVIDGQGRSHCSGRPLPHQGS